MPSAIEELLRYESPSQHTARLAPHDTELGGKRITQHQAVIAVMGAANRDPERFSEPDRLDLARPDNRHVAFAWARPLLLRRPARPDRRRGGLDDVAVAVPQASAACGTDHLAAQSWTSRSHRAACRARAVSEPLYASLSVAKRELIQRRLQGNDWPSDDPAPSPDRVAQLRQACLSVAQEPLWYFSQLAPGNPVYNEAVTIRKDGPFDVDAFREAFREIVRRHEIWRSTYELRDGEPTQVVHPVPELPLPLVDLSHLPGREAQREAAAMAAEEARRPYSLEAGPLVRPTLVRLGADHHRLYLALHHIVFDGVSLYRIILPELIALYNARGSALGLRLPSPRDAVRGLRRRESDVGGRRRVRQTPCLLA